MPFPDHFLDHLSGLPGFHQESFLLSHQQAPPTSIRANPSKPASFSFTTTPIPWSRHGFYLSERPSFTFDPLFHAGTYYVQEASSQLLEPIFQQHLSVTGPLRVLDLCAAPGGKSTHLLSLLREEDLLLSNEVIRSRSGVLIDNIEKWGFHNVVVSQEDPSVLGQLSGFFDLIVVDAPCSGSGLFRKDAEAMDHWSLSAVDHCAARQKRILKDIWPALKEGGILIYSTCSFSGTEDEEMVSWGLEQYDAEYLSVDFPSQWGVVSGGSGYRCWPHLIKGEGFFIAAIRKRSAERPGLHRGRLSLGKLAAWQKQQVSDSWDGPSEDVIEWMGMASAFPSSRMSDLQVIGSVCQPLRIGTRLGTWSRTDWIPDHALALSRYVGRSLSRVELDSVSSVKYLQRGPVESDGLARGWHLVTHQDRPMGWIKSIGSRINNYYPNHLRILKRTPDGG